MTTCLIMVFGLSVNFSHPCVPAVRLCNVGFQTQDKERLMALTYTGTARCDQSMYGAEQMLSLAVVLTLFNRSESPGSSVANAFKSGLDIGGVFRSML